MADDVKMYVLANGEVRVWIDQDSVHIKTADRFGDPVELADAEVKELAEALLKLYAAIRPEEGIGPPKGDSK